MTTVYTDIATVENAPTPGSPLESQKAKGKVRVVQAAFTFAGEAAGTILRICKLRKGDYVLMNSFFIHADLGSGVTLAVGDNDDTDSTGGVEHRYLAATALNAAGAVQFNDDAAKIATTPYKVQKDCWLQALTAGAAATGAIDFTIFMARAGA